MVKSALQLQRLVQLNQLGATSKLVMHATQLRLQELRPSAIPKTLALKAMIYDGMHGVVPPVTSPGMGFVSVAWSVTKQTSALRVRKPTRLKWGKSRFQALYVRRQRPMWKRSAMR
jgi:hypothetical protein